MEKLPNIVRDRLKPTVVTSHPDAELLNAFAQRAISDRERDSVLEHLAACSICREILALSTPEFSPVAATPSPIRPRVGFAEWFRWPVLRWASMAACVVVVGAAATLWRTERYWEKAATPAVALRSDAPSPISKQESQSVIASAQDSKLPTVERAETARGKADSKRDAKQYAQPAVTANAAKPSREPAASNETRSVNDALTLRAANANSPAASADAKSADANAAPHSEYSSGALDKAVVAAAPQPAPVAKAKESEETAENKHAAPPATNETVEVESDAVDLQSQAVSAETIAGPAKVQKNSEGRRSAAPAQIASGAKAGLSQQNLAERAAIAPSTSIMKDLVNARWTLSPEGLPQRSLDSGKTWEKMHVDNLTGFRALSAVGLEVWVGGLGGLLYHTNDVGMHWTRVQPVADGTPLTSDIIRIDFVDAQHGTLRTADQHLWTTADAGKSWQRN
jgi:hypothetical protein